MSEPEEIDLDAPESSAIDDGDEGFCIHCGDDLQPDGYCETCHERAAEQEGFFGEDGNE